MVYENPLVITNFILQPVTTPGNTRLTDSNGIIKSVFYKTKKMNCDVLIYLQRTHIHLYFTKKRVVDKYYKMMSNLYKSLLT